MYNKSNLGEFLKSIPTSSLVEELKKRESVEAKIVEPHTDGKMTICGPAIVLVVND